MNTLELYSIAGQGFRCNGVFLHAPLLWILYMLFRVSSFSSFVRYSTKEVSGLYEEDSKGPGKRTSVLLHWVNFTLCMFVNDVSFVWRWYSALVVLIIKPALEQYWTGCRVRFSYRHPLTSKLLPGPLQPRDCCRYQWLRWHLFTIRGMYYGAT